jgi:eukaryotic-like serine/threonine-protein kinase
VNGTSRLLGGRYQVGGLIGRGGMAEVHAGHDTRLGRTVAIKILRPDLARDPAFLSRFRREAQAAAGLNHPAIVATYDSGEDQDTDGHGASVPLPYIVMEYVEGHTLREILTQERVLDPAEGARVTEGILDALSYSHRMGIVHRDIKPANVMLTAAGKVKVMDFGIARAVADGAATQTQTQAVIGTAQYLSPEQAQGSPVDARSDLYSTGCLLYELLTGRTPFVGDSPVSIAYQHVGQAPQPPSAHRPEISADLDAVTLHALVKDRDARYQDAGQFRSDLAAARSGRPISSAAHGTAGALLGAGALAGAAGSGGDPTMAMFQGDATQVVGHRGGGQDNTATLPAIGRDPAELPRKRHRATYTLLALAVVVALVLVFLASQSLLKSAPEARQIAVPTVISMTQGDAEAKLRAAGFNPAVTLAASKVEKGKVFDQNPQPGVELAEKSTVTISVSTGPAVTEVPDVRTFTEASARTSLESAGLTVGKVELVNDSSLDKGKVIETVPAANTSVQAGSAVVLKVSSGQVKVPDVVNLKQAEALQALSDKKLTPKTDFKDSDKPEGTVLSQTPAAGGLVDAGAQIRLVIAKAPQPKPSPTTTTPVTPPTGGPTGGPPPNGG